jgi:hypothetical protein
MQMLANAEHACTIRVGPLDAFRGGAVERAWSNVHAAEALLIAVAPPVALRSVLPSVLDDALQHLGAATAQYSAVKALVKVSPSAPLPEGAGLTVAATALSVHHVSAADHGRVRSFRNVMLVATVALLAGALGFVVLGLLHPAWLPICGQGAKGCLVSAAPHQADLLVVALLGAAAGLRPARRPCVASTAPPRRTRCRSCWRC